MLRRLSARKWLPALLVLAVLAACLGLLPAHSWADAVSEACQGAGLSVGAGGKCSGGGDLNGVIQTAVNIISAIVGVVAVVMIIVGGFKYITSAGDANKVSNAKNTVIYAIVGLVIVAVAQLIVHFVIKQSADSASGAGVILYKQIGL
jgi:hypothetical protein